MHHTDRAQKKKPTSTLSTPFFYTKLLNMIYISPYHQPMIAQILHAGDGRFAGFGNLPVQCIKSVMPNLLTRNKIMYENWHLRPSTVVIWSCILWIEKLAGHGKKPNPKSRIFEQIETQHIIPEELQQRV